MIFSEATTLPITIITTTYMHIVIYKNTTASDATDHYLTPFNSQLIFFRNNMNIYTKYFLFYKRVYLDTH